MFLETAVWQLFRRRMRLDREKYTVGNRMFDEWNSQGRGWQQDVRWMERPRTWLATGRSMNGTAEDVVGNRTWLATGRSMNGTAENVVGNRTFDEWNGWGRGWQQDVVGNRTFDEWNGRGRGWQQDVRWMERLRTWLATGRGWQQDVRWMERLRTWLATGRSMNGMAEDVVMVGSLVTFKVKLDHHLRNVREFVWAVVFFYNFVENDNKLTSLKHPWCGCNENEISPVYCHPWYTGHAGW